MAAQNESTGTFQLLMNYMDEPFESIFKMVDLKVIDAQILMVSIIFMFEDTISS